MATHAIKWQTSQVYGRHSAVTSTVVSVLVQLLALLRQVWRAAWASSLQHRPQHTVRAPRDNCGVDDEFAVELHDWNDPNNTAPIPVLRAEQQDPVLCGYLVGNPYDQNGGAL